MAALPQAYRYDNIVAGMLSPDYEALERVLPSIDDGPIIDDMHKLGGTILAIGEALPKVGLQGTFAYIYGSLTLELANAVDGRPSSSRLPKIENPDDLMPQAGVFAQDWTTPVWHFVQYGKAQKAGDLAAQRYHASKIGPHYRYSFDAPEVQLSQPVVQFAAGGMEDHILGDLGDTLVRSGVSRAYMRRGGDFDNVNKYIRYVTMEKAPELMDGNRAMVYAAVQPVPLAIAGMREYARRVHGRLLRADDEAQYAAIVSDGEQKAARMSRQTVQYGHLAMSAFARMAGANPWPTQLAREISQAHVPDDGVNA